MKDKRKSGEKGAFAETLAVNFLKNKGYLIVERNFRTKFGEIDIVARENKFIGKKKLVFFEVKSFVCNNLEKSDFDPLENMHEEKLKKLLKCINFYLFSREKSKEVFSLKLITVKMNNKEKKAFFKIYEII